MCRRSGEDIGQIEYSQITGACGCLSRVLRALGSHQKCWNRRRGKRSRHDWKRMVLMGISWLGGGPWESLPTPPLGWEDTGQTA